MIEVWKAGDALELGDQVVFLGGAHRIDRFERDHLHAPRVAFFQDGASFAISSDVLYHVDADLPVALLGRVREAAA